MWSLPETMIEKTVALPSVGDVGYVLDGGFHKPFSATT